MLSIEKIENIIKSKYKDVNFKNNTFEFDKVKSEIIDWVDGCQMIEYISNEKLSYIRRPLINNQLAYADRQFEIENNAIELKHLLDIKITKQDMIDWIKTFKNYHNTLKSHIVIKNLYISINDKKEQYFYIKENRKSLSFYTYENFDKKSVNIFTATNSQEYWRLYNIIKNLKE